MENAQIIKGCKRNDEKCQKALFISHSKWMLGIAMRYTDDESNAKDVLQETFIRIFKAIKKFEYKNDARFVAWMKQILIRESLQWIRRKKIVFQEIEEGMQHRAPVILEEMNTQDLLEVLRELPSGYRTVFNLYAIEGYSHEEIGQILNIDKSTSRSQLSRARKMLQHRLMIQKKEGDRSPLFIKTKMKGDARKVS